MLAAQGTGRVLVWDFAPFTLHSRLIRRLYKQTSKTQVRQLQAARVNHG